LFCALLRLNALLFDPVYQLRDSCPFDAALFGLIEGIRVNHRPVRRRCSANNLQGYLRDVDVVAGTENRKGRRANAFFRLNRCPAVGVNSDHLTN
jgi:hypothetical protein